MARSSASSRSTFVFALRAGGARIRGARFGRRSFLRARAAGAVASFSDFTGYIAALGYDALALPLGLVAGLALLAVLVAPRFVLYPVRSISGFFAVRYGGNLARRLAMLITAAATVLLLAADLKAGACACRAWHGFEFPEAVTAVALGVAAIWLLGSILAIKKAEGAGFVVVLSGLLDYAHRDRGPEPEARRCRT